MNLLTTLIAFIFALGPLIVLHELGHYAVARLCGVKVLRFSVGLGTVLWSRRFGKDQTEWALSALPFGGYVKMLDRREEGAAALSPQELRREFTGQNVWRRIAILAAGPGANFIVALVLLTGLYMVGVAEPVTRLAPPAPATAAYAAGLRGGDSVSAVNGAATPGWSALQWQVVRAVVDHTALRLEVRRPGAAAWNASVPAQALAGLDLEGDLLGKLGLAMARPPPLLGEIVAGGAAARAGLRGGDLVLSVDGQPVADGLAFIGAVRAGAGKTLDVVVRRAGQPLHLAVRPDGVAEAAVTVGKIGAAVAQAPDMIDVPAAPLPALSRAATTVWDNSLFIFKMVGKMVSGEASLKSLSGPLSIADAAGRTARAGAEVYLGFIAFVSITLAVMNLLPIPVLDGGNLLYYSLEVLTGRPVPERYQAVLQRLGVGLLLTLMAVALFNDVTRLFFLRAPA